DAAIHLLRVAVHERREAEARKLAQLVRASGQPSLVQEATALIAYGFGVTADVDSMRRLAASMSPDARWVVATRVTDYTGRPDAAEDILRRGPAVDVGAAERMLPGIGLAQSLAAQGRWQAAAAEL